MKCFVCLVIRHLWHCCGMDVPCEIKGVYKCVIFAVGIDPKPANCCEAHPKPFVDHWDTVIHAYHSRDRCSCPQKTRRYYPPENKHDIDLKMYFPLNMGIFQCDVNFQVCHGLLNARATRCQGLLVSTLPRNNLQQSLENLDKLKETKFASRLHPMKSEHWRNLGCLGCIRGYTTVWHRVYTNLL